MCRFLLSKHADVDVYGYANNPFNRSFPIHLLGFVAHPVDASTEEVATTQELCKLLLNAGTDPMDTTKYSFAPFFNVFCADNTVST